VLEEEEVVEEPATETKRKEASILMPEVSKRDTFLLPDTAKEVAAESSIGKEPSKKVEESVDYEDPINDDYQDDIGSSKNKSNIMLPLPPPPVSSLQAMIQKHNEKFK
jgi:hypothetical protein